MPVSRAGAAVVLVFMVVLSMGAPYAIGAALQNSQATYSPQHDFTPDPGTVTFETSNLDATYYDNETVRNETGAVMTDGTDYEWYTTNGTLDVLAGGDLANDSNASITFTYHGHTPRQAAVGDAVVRSNQIIVMLPLLVAVVFMGAALLALRGVA